MVCNGTVNYVDSISDDIALCPVFAAIGAWIAQAYGGWTDAMTALLIFVAVDVATGLLCGFAG